MSEAQEVMALTAATTNLANTLGMTPEAVQAKKLQTAQSQQIDEFQNQEFTRHLQNTHAKNTAKRNVKTDETRNWIQEYQKDNPIDTANPDEWVKNLQQTLRDENPKLWNPSVVTAAATQEIINSKALMQANYSIGVERGKQVAETLTGVTQNIYTAISSPTLKPAEIDVKLAGYSMQLNDRLQAIHPGLNISVTNSKSKGPAGQPLLNISYTDPDAVHPSMTGEEMVEQSPIQKNNITAEEFQAWQQSFLTKEGPKLAGTYTQGEQARHVRNLKARDNATMIYDTETNSFMQVWEVTNADNNKQFMMGKGGDLSKTTPFSNMQSLMDTGRVQVVSANGKMLAQNMMTEWHEDPVNEGMPISKDYAAKIAASVRAYESGKVLGTQAGSGGSDKYAKDLIANVKSNIDFEHVAPEDQQAFTNIATEFSSALSRKMSVTDASALVTKAHNAALQIGVDESKKIPYDSFMRSYLSGGTPGGINTGAGSDAPPKAATAGVVRPGSILGIHTKSTKTERARTLGQDVNAVKKFFTDMTKEKNPDGENL